MNVFRYVSVCLILCNDVYRIHVQGFTPQPIQAASLHSSGTGAKFWPGDQRKCSLRRRRRNLSPLSSSLGNEDSVVEAIQSLVDYHQGTWEGRATSFSVTQDVAAGIVSRKTSPKYTISVKLGIGEENGNIGGRNSYPNYSFTETISFENKISSRSLSFRECNVDVDAVDASYSLDSTLPNIPSSISGTEKTAQFGIEHCIAASDDRRVRCVVLYGPDQNLLRILVHEENRLNSPSDNTIGSKGAVEGASLTAADLLEMQSDVDRLVDKFTRNLGQQGDASGSAGSINDTTSNIGANPNDDLMQRLQESLSTSSESDSQNLVPHMMSLLELTSGMWLGDAVIRDMPMVQEFPEKPGGRGFGSRGKSASSNDASPAYEFGSWSVGVQKVAWRWLWNYGEKIRQVIDVGKSMGAPMSTSLSRALSGSVCVDESLSRRVPSDQRMVYIDWDAETVGLVLGSVSMQLPRYLNFDSSASSNRPAKPFVTEFCLYQSSGIGELTEQTVDETPLPDIICSKISRVYNYQGTRLKQGVSSFYTLSRYGED